MERFLSPLLVGRILDKFAQRNPQIGCALSDTQSADERLHQQRQNPFPSGAHEALKSKRRAYARLLGDVYLRIVPRPFHCQSFLMKPLFSSSSIKVVSINSAGRRLLALGLLSPTSWSAFSTALTVSVGTFLMYFDVNKS